MKKSNLFCAGILYACVLSAQPSFQTSLQAGISLPLNSNDINAAHTGKAIHFGNHLDYTFGNSAVRVGLGAYIGYINALSTDNKYKQIGEAIAEKYRFATSQLTFNSASFKSTHILLGPVASFGSDKFNINIWAKGGYGLNEPGRYSVVYKENGVVNNIYINQSGENKNGLAYSAGAGIKLAISPYVGLQLAAGYFSTQTDQVNYNFDREKGTTPLYYTAANQFIQASAGLQFTIGNPGKKNTAYYDSGSTESDTGNPTTARMDQKIKTKSNIKNDRVIYTGEDNPAASGMDQKIKTKSNIKNDRLANNAGNNTNDNAGNDSLFFSPEKIELRSKVSDFGRSRIQLLAVDNYLTGFVYQTQRGAVISQCGSNAMPGEPIPGIDVRLRRTGAAANDVMAVRTNRDGSFSFNNIAPGNYNAEAGTAAMDITVRDNNENVFKTLDINGGSCGNTKENYIINAGDKTYVEVITAREAGSGMATGKKNIGNVKYEDIKVTSSLRDAATGLATGKRMHKPYRVADTDFEINPDNIVSSEGKLYAEVITAREASSGMATGRRTIVTGDVDGDGLSDYTVVSPRDAATGMSTGRRMHKPYVITKELDAYETIAPRDAAAGMATGRLLPTVNKKNEIAIDESGVHKSIISPRDAASGLPAGRRQYQPLIIRIDPDEDTYEVVSPRDAASGLPTGKRMHKPFVITKELGFTEDGDEVVTYRIVHSDLAVRNVLLDDEDDTEPQKMAITEQGMPKKKGQKKGIITGKDNDNGMYADRDVASGLATGRRVNQKTEDAYEPWNDDASDQDAVSNPLYESSGNQGVNPLFEAKTDLRVSGSNGKDHDIFIPENIMLTGNHTGVTGSEVYEIAPIRWMAPESMTERKGITEKGIKKNEAAARKGWDGSVKGSGKNINTSEDNLGSGNITKDDTGNNTARKGWDGVVKGGAVVKNISRVRCMDGTCAVEAIVEVGGVEYEAVVSGVLKTKHDTVKNSIGNIR